MAVQEITTSKLVDLDLLLQEFNTSQKVTMDMSCQNGQLQAQLDSNKKLLTASKEREQVLQQEVSEINHVVETLQATLAKRCDWEDETRSLQSKLHQCEEAMKKQSKAHEEKLEEIKRATEAIHSVHKSELELLETSLKQGAEKEKQQWKQSAQEKDREIERLQHNISHLEQEKQAEVAKLRLEYDGKLLKIQKQAAKTQATSVSSANQDIFRKKLQHVKSESEREIAGLKRTIMELQQKLTAKEQKLPSGSSLSKRRKF